MNKTIILLAVLFIHTTAAAQSNRPPAHNNLNYTYAELRFVDVDVSGGDGIKVAGSFDVDGTWLIVGALTAVDFNNNVDSTLIELGGGYVWKYSEDFDLISTVRLIRSTIDTPGGDFDDNGIALSAGVRGLLTREFEIRGSINHINLNDSDTYLELAGDYYFSRQFSAGLSLEFAGDADTLTLGARWYF